MPPKKKKGGKKGKKGAKETTPKEQELQKFKTENELLKLEVSKQIGICRRAKADHLHMGEELVEARITTESQKKFGDDVALSLTRNLHQLQAEKSLEEHDFNNQINSLLRRIEQLETELESEKQLRIETCEQKDGVIRQLQNQVDSMEENYQNVLSNSFSSLSSSISNLQVEWEDDALDYLTKHGTMLLDFGLKPSALKAEFSNLDVLRL